MLSREQLEDKLALVQAQFIHRFIHIPLNIGYALEGVIELAPQISAWSPLYQTFHSFNQPLDKYTGQYQRAVLETEIEVMNEHLGHDMDETSIRAYKAAFKIYVDAARSFGAQRSCLKRHIAMLDDHDLETVNKYLNDNIHFILSGFRPTAVKAGVNMPDFVLVCGADKELAAELGRLYLVDYAPTQSKAISMLPVTRYDFLVADPIHVDLIAKVRSHYTQTKVIAPGEAIGTQALSE
ncbi:MAG: hypothetical protein KJ922_02215 [Nanoarchaeota archaeon]|nr:hypothetical protein [Nanoarchaeota archaeon]